MTEINTDLIIIMKHFNLFQFCARLATVWLHVKAGYSLCSKMIANENKGYRLLFFFINHIQPEWEEILSLKHGLGLFL